MSRSIRETLTRWYIGILAVILCLFGGVIYVRVVAGLAHDVEKTLVLQADHVAGTIIAFREAEEATTSSGGGNWQHAPPGSFLGAIDRGQLPDLINRWGRKTENLRTERALRLVDNDGQMVIASPSFSRLDLPLTKTAVAVGLKQRTVYETFRRSGQRILLVTRPVIEHGRVLYLVQIAASLKQVDASALRFLCFLLVLIPLTLVLARSVGWFLATTALDPVASMIAHTRRIGSQRLEERVPVPGTGDELDQLATTFNEMLTRLERDFRRLRQFSAAASHELRTPLTVMRGELELALRRPRTPEEYQRTLRTHLAKTDELSAIVEELLMLAHREATDGAVEWAPTDLSVVAREMSGPWRDVAKTQSVRLEVVAHQPLWVMGERRLLERLVANLLDNAIKHTPPHGQVTITSDQEDRMARLRIHDTGPGIPAEELPQLFDRFFRPGLGSSGPRTTGLGLGLCRWIVEIHHGRLEVSSPPGDGATFTTWLPIVHSSN